MLASRCTMWWIIFAAVINMASDTANSPKQSTDIQIDKIEEKDIVFSQATFLLKSKHCQQPEKTNIFSCHHFVTIWSVLFTASSRFVTFLQEFRVYNRLFFCFINLNACGPLPWPNLCILNGLNKLIARATSMWTIYMKAMLFWNASKANYSNDFWMLSFHRLLFFCQCKWNHKESLLFLPICKHLIGWSFPISFSFQLIWVEMINNKMCA